jgi:Zn-dependent protease
MELPQDLLGMLLVPVIAMAFFSMLINTLLMVVNLIPIPPLDGGRILISLLPPSLALSLRRVEPFGLLIILGLFFLQPNFIHSILGTTIQWLAVTFLPQEMM